MGQHAAGRHVARPAARRRCQLGVGHEEAGAGEPARSRFKRVRNSPSLEPALAGAATPTGAAPAGTAPASGATASASSTQSSPIAGDQGRRPRPVEHHPRPSASTGLRLRGAAIVPGPMTEPPWIQAVSSAVELADLRPPLAPLMRRHPLRFVIAAVAVALVLGATPAAGGGAAAGLHRRRAGRSRGARHRPPRRAPRGPCAGRGHASATSGQGPTARSAPPSPPRAGPARSPTTGSRRSCWRPCSRSRRPPPRPPPRPPR